MNKNKDKTYIAEAWYCPTLPFSFNKRFMNYRMVLELQDDTFVASKIELYPKFTQNIELKDNQKSLLKMNFTLSLI
jgi:hypothetical protein